MRISGPLVRERLASVPEVSRRSGRRSPLIRIHLSSYPFSEHDETEFNFAAFRWHKFEHSRQRNPSLALPLAAEALLDLGGSGTEITSRRGSPQRETQAVDASALIDDVARSQGEFCCDLHSSGSACEIFGTVAVLKR